MKHYFVPEHILNTLKPKDHIKINDIRLGHPNNDARVATVEKGGFLSKFTKRITGVVLGTFHDNTPFVYTVWIGREPTLEYGV